MVEPIAKPIGLFKAGPSGIGGMFEPMTPKGIRHDLFQTLSEGIVYGLEINAGAGAPTEDSMIVDVIYDANKPGVPFVLHDPHKSFTVEQVTDYPVDVATRGLVWFCGAPVPRYEKYSKVGKHTVTIKVAPRVAPTGTNPLPLRDFSPQAGGVIQTFEYMIYDENLPPIPDDEP